VQHIEVEAATALDTDSLQSVLRADAAGDIKAVLITHTDTASTVRNDIAAVRGCIDAVDHPALLMVDCIASLGCEPYRMSEWGVDVTVAACQKGLMTPPGLAFNFIGKKAWQAYQQADLKTAYWDWDRRVNGTVFHQKFCGTPATHHVYGLREALDMIAEEGLENIWRRHAQLVNAVWAAVDAWSTQGSIRLLVDDKACRSTAVTAIETAEGDATAIRQWAENEAGVVLGVGLELESVMGGQSNQLFRIGHMGHLNPPMLLGTLATVDTALKALKIDHGSGALEAASAALAMG
jgi:alanine-glyoxylate transaminase/serine-glyoxylate transaminase/serine-pyruvate transaminase